MAITDQYYRNLTGASAQSTGYTIDQSIRFNDDDNAYLAKTFSSAGNRRTFTISTWVKRGNLSTNQMIFGPYTSSSGSGTYGAFRFPNGNTFEFFDYTNGTTNYAYYTSPRLFRDPSAWYHIVAALDTTLVIASERIKVYINGVRDVGWSGNVDYYPSLNYQGQFNNALVHEIGRTQANTQKLDAYLADFHFIDGYAYDSSYFGEFKEDTDIWIPKEYTGSYGSNGFKIDGRDSSDLGDDESGNGNDFATNGLASNDQRADTPTNNQITFNPLNNQQSGGTLTNGNLDYTGPSTRTNISLTANIPATGKWAVAFKATNNSNDEWNMGITKSTNTNFGDAAGSNEAIGGQDNDGIQFLPSSNDASLYNYISSAAIDPSLPITTSDEFWMAVDMGTGKCFLGIYDASATAMKFVAADAGIDGNPATGDNPTITISDMIGSLDYAFAVNSKSTNVWTLLRSTEVSGTTPTGYTYFENVKDLL